MYVGKTEDYPPENRWKEHLKDYKRPRCEKRPFYDAIKRYGPEHFHFEVIEETEDVCEREIYWIDRLRTYVGFKDCNGYNGTLGGDGKKYLNLDEDEVIDYHLNQAEKVVKYTANHFEVDVGTIKKILRKHNIDWMRNQQIQRYIRFKEHGYIYQVSESNDKVLNKYTNESDIIKLNPDYKDTSLSEAILGKERANKLSIHKYKGFYWYNDTNIPSYLKELT